MPKANVVYWYGVSEMPRDGGGLRALAWHEALSGLGYEVEVHPLRSVGTGTGDIGLLRRLKKSLIPMPLEGDVPSLPSADLNVITVPSVFASAARSLPRETLIFDWMDLWSVNARTMANSSRIMLPGGVLQSMWWKALEARLPRTPAANTFAGHNDFKKLSGKKSSLSAWLPTPVAWPEPSQERSSKTHKRIGFLANMNYPPNAMSLRKFLDAHEEKLDLLGMELVVAGYGSEIVNTWTNKATVLGPLADVSTFYSSIDAAIVPIDHGGGIKVKALEAMVHGVPIYGTTHVREGFDPSFWSYIGDVDELMNGLTAPVPVAPLADLELRFTAESFRYGVADLLSRAGFQSA